MAVQVPERDTQDDVPILFLAIYCTYASYLAYVAVSCCRQGVVGPLGLGNLGLKGQ